MLTFNHSMFERLIFKHSLPTPPKTETMTNELKAKRHYDVIIIGGGINGVGVAQAAAAKGYSVLLLEKSDLAAGTSHASSKLIHGGLRYLESYEFSLVYEALRERSMMLKNAPELVTLKPFYIPVYKSTRRAPWLIFAGLSLYALCDRLRPSSRFKIIPKAQWHTLDGIKTEGLRAVFQYYDAQTDDTLLTRAVMNSATLLGAELKTQATFITATRHKNVLDVVFDHNEQRYSCTANTIVNAGGPWANKISDRMQPKPRKLDIDLIQGTHIVIEGALSEQFYYVESPRDGRAVFVMPWYGNTLIGTTEATYTGHPDDIKPLDSSIRYLINIFRHYFPDFNGGDAPKVIRSFAGARVLPRATDSAFKRSRETVLYWEPAFNDKGVPVCTIYGGKLTAWRATAEKVMKTIAPLLPAATAKADTKSIKLFRPE